MSARTRALVVPDEQTWTVLGADPAARGVEPAYELDDVPIEYGELPAAAGAAIDALLEHDREARDDHSHGNHEHGHGDHHDMMAIVGEPSADGLVMERIELTYGPLGTPLPGGLAAAVTLDGDVVAECTVHALLRSDPPAAPDLLAPVAWTVATASRDPATSPWLRIAAVEVERAVSHLAWLRSLGRLLDWQPLVERCTRTLASLQVGRRVLPGAEPDESWLRAAVGEADFERCCGGLEDLVSMVGRSRALRRRLAGQAPVTRAQAVEQGLLGPVGRAAGNAADVRADDPAYRELGFEPVVRSEGDALARTLVRGEEALAAAQLAIDALESAYVGADAPASAPAVEGPRGPIAAHRLAWEPAARRAAAAATVGREWSAALVALVSFDLSPWSAGA